MVGMVKPLPLLSAVRGFIGVSVWAVSIPKSVFGRVCDGWREIGVVVDTVRRMGLSSLVLVHTSMPMPMPKPSSSCPSSADTC